MSREGAAVSGRSALRVYAPLRHVPHMSSQRLLFVLKLEFLSMIGGDTKLDLNTSRKLLSKIYISRIV